MPYAVRRGKVPGVYNSWEQCSLQVSGYGGAIYKKFKTVQEAEDFISKSYNENSSVTSSHLTDKFDHHKRKYHDFVNIVSDNNTSVICCKCGIPAVQRISQKDNSNKGKKFYCCSNRDCKYFEWIEKEDVNHVKNSVQINNDTLLSISQDKIVIYCDGGCHGNNNSQKCPAGWGFVVLCILQGCTEENGIIVFESYGPVLLDPNHPHYLGAEVGSNNTAELSGMGESLLWLKHNWLNLLNRYKKRFSVCIRYDSEYAMNSVVGKWNGEKNRDLIDTVRLIYAEVKRLVPLDFIHVKGHSGDKWNDRADELAQRGIRGEERREEEVTGGVRIGLPLLGTSRDLPIEIDD